MRALLNTIVCSISTARDALLLLLLLLLTITMTTMMTMMMMMKAGAAFSKVPRKILGKLLIGATDTQVATSPRGYSATVEHCTNRPVNSVQRSNRKLCSSRLVIVVVR